MLPYVLTALAGLVLGVVATRIWAARDSAPAPEGNDAQTEPAATARPAKGSLLSSRMMLIAAAIVAVIAVVTSVLREPGRESGLTMPTDTQLPLRAPAASMSGLDDVDVMIERLAKRLETDRNDGEGFRMLGWSYVSTGKPDKAVTAYQRAIALLPKRADVRAGYGEALVGVAGGTVTPDAKAAFDKAIALDANEPRARYFEALYRAQHGDERGALDAWIKLANGGPADAPWQPDLRQRIAETAAKLNLDVSGRLKPAAAPAGPAASALPPAAAPPIDQATVSAVTALPPADRQAMIDKMVEGLAAKLAANPKDADGWVRLLRSRMVLNQAEQAGKDLATARLALQGAPADLASVDAAAKSLGVPGS